VRKKLRIALLIFLGVLAVIAAGLFGLYRASQQVPKFYRQAITLDPVAQKQASDQMLQQAAALASDLRKEGRWQAVFTAEQINGWLAVDLLENHPGALPRSLRDPRVAIDPDGVTLGCRFQRGNLNSVVTLTIQPYLPEPNVLALRIHKARAGLLPMPLAEILDRISQTARRMELRLEWRQTDGDPVALISIPPPRDQQGKVVRIETLRFRDGEIYLAGTTRATKGEGGRGKGEGGTEN